MWKFPKFKILTQFLKLVLLKQIWPLGHESESVIRHDWERTISFFRYRRKSATQHWTTSAELGKEQFMRLTVTFYQLLSSGWCYAALYVYVWNYSTINGNTEFSGKLEIRTFNILIREEYWVNTKGN